MYTCDYATFDYSFSKFWQTQQKSFIQLVQKVLEKWAIVIKCIILLYSNAILFMPHSGTDRGEKTVLLCDRPLLLSHSQPGCLQFKSMLNKQKLIRENLSYIVTQTYKALHVQLLQSHQVLSSHVVTWSTLCSSPNELPPESSILLNVSND